MDCSHGTLDRIGPGGLGAARPSPCDSTAAALAFIDTLEISPPEDDLVDFDFFRKGLCPGCSKWVRLYCSRCVRSVVPVPEPLQLGLKVLILRHPKEAPAKSSATPLPLLSPDVEVHEWGPGLGSESFECLRSSGTWLVYPGEAAVDARDVEWDGVKCLVLVDSRWKHARTGSGHVRPSFPALSGSQGCEGERSFSGACNVILSQCKSHMFTA